MVRKAEVGDYEALCQSIDKITASAVLRSAEALCNLLRFLGRQVIEQPATPPKEYQIATEVFGRGPAFDSRLDSTVRVQVGRLRSKLAEYYAGPGAHDDLIIEVPKGSYSLSLHDRRPQGPIVARWNPGVAVLSSDSHTLYLPTVQRLVRRWPVLLLGLALVCIASYSTLRKRAASDPSGFSDAVRGFWRVFVDRKEPPLVIFSNAEFVGAPAMGMRYFNSATDSPQSIRDHYTGVGEVFAVHELDRLFSRFHCEMGLKRGRLLAWDDAKGRNLIFIGSSAENLPLREISDRRSFVFKLKDTTPRASEVGILNVHPAPGEQGFYMSSAGLPVTEDHAVIALLPALEKDRWVLILAGTTTLGTQAATEFVCRPNTLQELLSRLHQSDAALPVAFEAVIKAKVSGGVPVQSQVVALRVRSRRPL